MTTFFLSLGCFIAGVSLIKALDFFFYQQQRDRARDDAERIEREAKQQAETIVREARLKSKEELQELKDSAEKELADRRREAERAAERLHKLEEEKIKSRQDELDRVRAETEKLRVTFEEGRQKIESVELRLKTELERIGELSKDKAREQLLQKVEEELELDLARKIKDFEARFKEESRWRAKDILSQAVHRCSVDFTTEALVTVVPLPSDEMKGRIIGREGRNIRAFEHLTGVNVIVDDTPEAVVLSAFSPIKREIARLTMEKMITDGRIHPAKIEQIYEQCQKDLYSQIREVGEDAVLKLSLTGLHEKMVFEIGKMKYRYSYGQNLLEHSFEVANIATTIAAEIGANIEMTRRSAFLHDIGKVAEGDMEGPHALVGGEIAERLGEKRNVVNAIAAHHEEVEQETVEATLVQVADTLSAGRPGARRNTLDSYIKRLEHMESIAREFRGVVHAYAIQAGREIRVMVRPGEVDDVMCSKLANDIVKKIETSMEYPGQIKVVVMRETRAVDIAR